MSNKGKVIAISGKSGCGNTTVTNLVAEKLGFRVINYTFRTMAEEKGISFDEMCALAETDDRYDLALDKKQKDLAMEGNCVLGSRLAIWLLKNQADLTVFLDASLEVRANRISRREGRTNDEAVEKTVSRDHRDHERYKRIYSIDNDDFYFADLVIDSGKYNQHEISEMILMEFNKRLQD